MNDEKPSDKCVKIRLKRAAGVNTSAKRDRKRSQGLQVPKDTFKSISICGCPAGNVIQVLRDQRLIRAAELVEEHIGETLTYYSFPDEHWQKIRTNNPLERTMREIRRRTRVVRAFPDGQGCLNLAAARLRHIAGSKWSGT